MKSSAEERSKEARGKEKRGAKKKLGSRERYIYILYTACEFVVIIPRTRERKKLLLLLLLYRYIYLAVQLCLCVCLPRVQSCALYARAGASDR